MKAITTIEIKKNRELARCWSDICKWAKENCKDITFSYRIGSFATLFIYKGKAMINANANNEDIEIRGEYIYTRKGRNKITSVIRKQPLPFALIEDIVTNWDKCKAELEKQKENYNNIMNFKP